MRCSGETIPQTRATATEGEWIYEACADALIVSTEASDGVIPDRDASGPGPVIGLTGDYQRRGLCHSGTGGDA